MKSLDAYVATFATARSPSQSWLLRSIAMYSRRWPSGSRKNIDAAGIQAKTIGRSVGRLSKSSGVMPAARSAPGACSRADPQSHSPAPRERGIHDRVHLFQETVDSIVLSFGQGDLNGIEQREYLRPLISEICTAVRALLSASFGEIGEKRLHGVAPVAAGSITITCWRTAARCFPTLPMSVPLTS